MNARVVVDAVLAAAVLVLLIGWSTTGVVDATYAPSSVVKLCAYTGSSLGTPCSAESLSAGANADMTFDLSLPTGNLNTGLQVISLPGSAVIPGAETNSACSNSTDDDGDAKVNDGCPYVPPDSETSCSDSTDSDGDGAVNDGCLAVGAPLLGAVAGKAAISVQAGFLNSPCNSTVASTMYLFNSSTDIEFTINTRPQGYVTGEGPFEEFRDDIDANKLPQHVEMYPSFLNELFDADLVGDINGDGDWFDTVGGVQENPGASATDPFGTVEPVRPLARYSGTTLISGQAILFQMLVFSPGGLSTFKHPHPLSDFYSSSVGYTAITILGDPTLPTASDDVADLCSPTSAEVLLWGKTRDNPCLGGTCPNDDTPCYISCGNNDAINDFTGSSPAFSDSGTGTCSGSNTAGCIRWANPSSAGTKLFAVYDQSQRDADGDGIENALDTCPYTATTGYNPRNYDATNDPDADGIPKTAGGSNGCDPTPTVDTGAGNHDGDSSAGGSWQNREDNCPLVSNSTQADSESITPLPTAAPRGGPRTDDIGDPCDSQPTVANGAFYTRLTPIAKCIGSTDSDSDGYCNSDETTWGSNPNSSASTPENPAVTFVLPLTNAGSGATQVGEPQQACNDGVDNDGDGLTDTVDGSYAWSGTTLTLSGCVATDIDGDGFKLGEELWVFYAEWSVADCQDTTDDDSDGWINDGCFVQGTAETVCSGSSDNDSDGYPNDGCPPVATGSQLAALDPCGGTGWPSDLVPSPAGDNLITVLDQSAFSSHFGQTWSNGPPGYNQRFDMRPDGAITILDVTKAFTTPPPMLNGDSPFGSKCPYP